MSLQQFQQLFEALLAALQVTGTGLSIMDVVYITFALRVAVRLILMPFIGGGI